MHAFAFAGSFTHVSPVASRSREGLRPLRSYRPGLSDAFALVATPRLANRGHHPIGVTGADLRGAAQVPGLSDAGLCGEVGAPLGWALRIPRCCWNPLGVCSQVICQRRTYVLRTYLVQKVLISSAFVYGIFWNVARKRSHFLRTSVRKNGIPLTRIGYFSTNRSVEFSLIVAHTNILISITKGFYTLNLQAQSQTTPIRSSLVEVSYRQSQYCSPSPR